MPLQPIANTFVNCQHGLAAAQDHSPCSTLAPPFSSRCLWDTSASSSFATSTSDASPPRPAAELRNVRSVDSATGHLVGPCSSCDRPRPIHPSYICAQAINQPHSHPASDLPPPFPNCSSVEQLLITGPCVSPHTSASARSMPGSELQPWPTASLPSSTAVGTPEQGKRTCPDE